MSRILALLLLCLAIGGLTTQAAPPAPPQPDEVARLIRQLGDDDYNQREAASKRLAELGMQAWPAMRRTINAPGDAEVRTRCAHILKDGTLRIFLPLAEITGHAAPVISLAISSDGKRLVSGSQECVIAWSLPAGEMDTFTMVLSRGFGFLTAALSQDGKCCLTSVGGHREGKDLIKTKDYAIRVLDHRLNEVRRLVGHTDEINSIVFLPDGKRALSAGQDRTIRLWDIETGKEIRKFVGHAGAIRRLAVSRDGKQLLSSSQDTTVRCWNVDTGEEISRFNGHHAEVFGVAFTPDGKHAVSVGADKMARLWLTATGQEVRRFEGHTQSLMGVAVSPDGRWLLTSGGRMTRVAPGFVTAKDDFDIRLWDLASGDEIHRLTGNTTAVPVVLFAPDGKSILAAGSDNTIRRWKFDIPPAR